MSNRPKLFWLGLFLLASGWQFLVPSLTPPHFWLGGLLVAAGALVNGVSLKDAPRPVLRRDLLAYALTALLVIVLAPLPHRFGGVVLLAGVILLWPARLGYRGAGFGQGVLLTGVILIATSACLPVLLSFFSQFHRMGYVAPVVSQAFRLFGYQAQCDSSTVFVQAYSGVREYAVASEYFGWPFLFPATLGALVWHLLGPFEHRLRSFLVFLLNALVYALGRYVLLALLYLDVPLFPMFWSPWVLCCSFLPLFLLLAVWPWTSNPFVGRTECAERRGFPLRQALGSAALAVALACLAAAWGWEDMGRVKPGRLIIDEAHSRWEKLDRKYDTGWYGEESGYNYYCLDQFLGYYYHVRHNSAKLSDALLADCDILLIKTPTSAFTPEEIDTIERFVRRGGGLLLIGDHTNVFGTSTYLNDIARRFGLHYNYDATYDLATGGLSFYERPRLLPHPVVQRLPPFLFGTSCTLEVPLGGAIPIRGYALRTAGHDYSATSFFSHNTDGPHVTFGLFPQLGAVKLQRGRVLAFTDSTVFSNFWMFIPGKPELLLGCTNWLNHQSLYEVWAAGLAALSLVLAAAAALGLRGWFTAQFPALLAVGSLGFFAGAYLSAAANCVSYPLPAPLTHYRTIAFERQYSHFELPSDSLFHLPNADFHTFYVWVQRVGYVPRVSPALKAALADNDGLVMLNPTGPTAARDLQSIKEYVRKGGVLYVFDSPTNRASAANRILAQFGLALTNGPPESQSIFDGAGGVVALDRHPGLACGGQGVLFTAKHQPVLALAREGNGTVIFSADAELFSNACLGTTGTVPDETRKRLYGVIFDLFRRIEMKSDSRNR